MLTVFKSFWKHVYSAVIVQQEQEHNTQTTQITQKSPPTSQNNTIMNAFISMF